MTEPADPLADVFPGTADAPLPQWSPSRRPQDGGMPVLLPGWSDQRWAPRPLRPPVPAEPAEPKEAAGAPP